MFFLGDVLLVLCRNHFFNLLTSVTWLFLGATGDPQSACLTGRSPQPLLGFSKTRAVVVLVPWRSNVKAKPWAKRNGKKWPRCNVDGGPMNKFIKKYGHLLGISWEEDFFDGIPMEYEWNMY